ncbi:MAG: hydantoinase B/oxoprolinase family protein, partial [Alphaproteobacteria bacterium]|nr:hydantoinase B/oxoprolinase family protein [Alphaproteobacteria bacterium]
DKNWGDLNAVIAALGTAEARVHEAVRKWGANTVEQGRDALIGYAEARARALIDRLPDGAWSFHDYLEDDVVSDMPVRVKLGVTKQAGGNIHLNFTGSDPQIGAAFNLASAGKHPFLCAALFGLLRTLDPAIPINGGLIRPVRMTAPEGSIVNATFPAACGVRFAINQLTYGILQAVFAQALPGVVPAAGAGQATILAVSIMDPATGRRRANVVQPMIGGSGGRPQSDGIDGTDFSLGSLANTPTESLENEVPLLIRHYGVVPDSGGAGRWRGGHALRLDFEVFQPDTIVTARGMDRFKFQPWGLDGGRAGATGQAWLNPDSSAAKQLGKINVIRLGVGEVLSIRTPGGGGYGDPLERPIEAVAADIHAGLTTVDAAARDFGVIAGAHGIDREATSERRAELRSARNSQAATQTGAWPDRFDGGAGRQVHERKFSPELSDVLAELLFTLPPAARYFAKQEAYKRIRAAEAPLSPTVLHALWAKMIPELGLFAGPNGGGAAVRA